MTYVIAEIGINANGSLDLAKQLIDMAAECGCDAVKFQKRTVDVVYTEDFLAIHRESPWGTTQRDQKDGLEFAREDYVRLAYHAGYVGIEWSASAWDLEALAFVESFDPPWHKIASPMITNLEFVDAVAALGRPVFMSTGMSHLGEIDAACRILRNAICPVTLMHCVSTYPARDEDLNLLCIPALAKRYGEPVGYSGHEVSTSPSLVAVALGAVAIERHITLDRSMYGSDQSASLERAGLEALVRRIRKVPAILGDGIKRVTEEEAKIAKKLRG